MFETAETVLHLLRDPESVGGGQRAGPKAELCVVSCVR